MFNLKLVIVLLGQKAQLRKTGMDSYLTSLLYIATVVAQVQTVITNRRSYNAIPEDVVIAGANRGITMRTAAGATWLGAGQRITCTKDPPVEITTLDTNCQSRGCNFHATTVNQSHAELYFVADRLWYNTSIACSYFLYEWLEEHQFWYYKRRELWAPIDVRDPPEIQIEPKPADVYRNHGLVAVCRASSSLVAAHELQLLVLGDDGKRLDATNQSIDETQAIVEIRVTFQPHELQFVRYIRCNAFLGAEPDLLYRSSASPVTVRDVPKLVIVPIGATFVLGSTVTIACIADGFVIGRLVWTVACASCTFTEQSWPQNSSYMLTSTTSATKTITFTASHNWDGTTVGCHPLGYTNLAVYNTLTVKQFPLLTISPSEIETYDGQGVTVSCFTSGETSNVLNTEVRKLQLVWSVLPQRDRSVTWNSDEELVYPRNNDNFSVTTVTGETSSYIHFKASPYWINKTVGCSIETGNPADAKGTRVSANVRVFEPPTVYIEPRLPLVEQGSDVTLSCTAYGLVLGGLQWRVDCSACEYRVQPVAFSSKRNISSIAQEVSSRLSKRSLVSSPKHIRHARLQVIITISDFYQNVTAECGVSGTGGWPKAFIALTMPVSPIAISLRWIGVLLAAAVIFTVFIVIKRKIRASRFRKKGYNTSTEPQLTVDFHAQEMKTSLSPI